MANEIFIDWLSISQLHFREEPYPVFCRGVTVNYDREGQARHERVCSDSLTGSFDTNLQIKSDGSYIALSGNPGRYSRRDNLFGYGVRKTFEKVNRIMLGLALPVFTSRCDEIAGNSEYSRGARISRLDITCNYTTGSEGQARALIRFLASRSVARMKKGRAGDESVWWVNTRHMLKAYIKHIEMLKHGCSPDDPVYLWCKKNGVVRVELELKRRLLSDEGLRQMENLTDDRIVEIFKRETEIFSAIDRSNEPDILDAIPQKSRVYASAWLAGQDMQNLASRATLFRHAKVLREYGMNILEPRNVETFPTIIRTIELQPLAPPDWYYFDDEILKIA